MSQGVCGLGKCLVKARFAEFVTRSSGSMINSLNLGLFKYIGDRWRFGPSV